MKWTRAVFERFIDTVEESNRLLHLCMQGLSSVQGIPELSEVILRFRREDGKITEEEMRAELEPRKAAAQFAEAEISKGFPALHAHAVVAQWGALDALIGDLMIVWVLNEPAVLQSNRFAKIRIPLAEYEMLEREEKIAFLVGEAARSVNSDLKVGISKFEVQLEAIGLDGSVEDSVRRDLYEVSQVRNLLVHRAGVADRRFAAACPWIPTPVGAKHSVSHDDYVRYHKALESYVLTLINRVQARFGVEASEAGATDTPAAENCDDTTPRA